MKNKGMWRRVLATLIVVATVPGQSLVRADDQKGVGRTPDGRAYRVDNQGNEIVDYIAELELQQDALNRRIQGLEDEVKEKDQTIERLGRGGTVAAPAVAEKTLVGGADGRGCEALRAELTLAKDEVSALRERAKSEVSVARESCELEIGEREQSCSVRVAAIAKERDAALVTARTSTPMVAAAGSPAERCPKVTCGATAVVKTAVDCTPVENELTTRELELQTVRGELKVIQQQLAAATRERESLQAQLVALTTRSDEAERLEVELRTVRAELEQKQVKLLDLDRGLAEARLQVTKLEGERDVVRGQMREPLVVAASGIGAVRGGASNARQAVVESLRGSLLQELNKVKSLVADRDRRFGSGRTSIGSNVQVRASPLISSRGRSLAWVSGSVRNARSVHELADLRSDLAEIRSRVQEDLAFMKRMGGRR